MNKILLLFLALSLNVFADTLPNEKLTQGHSRVVSTQDLCTTSTKLVRNVHAKLKKQIYTQYGLTGNHTGYCKDLSKYDNNGSLIVGQKDEGCEIDHLRSLQLGGSNDITNLWPQPYFGQWNAHDKDLLEGYLHRQICKGKLTIDQAQKEISTNWIESYKSHKELPQPK